MNGTNEFGFTALPGGCRNAIGEFYGIGKYGGWWSATKYYADDAWSRSMDHISKVNRHYIGSSKLGFSARCIKSHVKSPVKSIIKIASESDQDLGLIPGKEYECIEILMDFTHQGKKYTKGEIFFVDKSK